MRDKEPLWAWAWYALCGVWLLSWAFWLTPVAYWPLWLLLGYALADVGSYLFHYIIDHYGDPHGPGLVREFQMHHLEPWGIARRSVSEAIAPAARIVAPILSVWLLLGLQDWLPGWLLLMGFEVGVLWVFTQVFHRWAHMPTRGVVRWAQRLGLIIGARAHRQHHKAPFHSHFGVINGWSNWPLDKLGAMRLVDAGLQGLGYRKHGLSHSLRVIEAERDAEAAGTFSRHARSHY